jgi:tRNA uracil 4-sulfurtransferase
MELPFLFIIRPSAEIGLKTLRKRMVFLRKLEGNINVAFTRAGFPYKLRFGHRFYFLETSEPARARSILKRIFGISSFSPIALKCARDLNTICEAGEKIFGPLIQGKTFCVRARRFGAQKISTREIEIGFGARLAAFGKVKLVNPEITVGVELHNSQALIYWEKIPGAKGFPSGVQNRALCLISGGFDSPVAAWRVMRRGVNVDFVYFNLGGLAHERQVLQICKVLVEGWAAGQNPRLFVVDFGDVVSNLKTVVQTSYRQVILKRLMMRAASVIGKEIGAQALITGEAIAQVSSQTLPNLDVITRAASLNVLRPLVGMEKEEIIAQAEVIATGFLSEKVQESCSITRGSPVIFAKPQKVTYEETKLDFALLDSAVSKQKIFDLMNLDVRDLHRDYLLVDAVSGSDTLIDCQPSHLYRVWHAENSVHFEPDTITDEFLSLDKGKRYVLYCTYGTNTPKIAELMQRQGFEAYAFRGGVKQLRTIL